MSYLMTSAALCAKALDIAENYKTSYKLGPWGWPATDKMITRATTNGSNAQTNKKWLSYANAIKGKGFLFDCVGPSSGAGAATSPRAMAGQAMPATASLIMGPTR